MRECDRLKWALFCGYKPIHFIGDCCGYACFIMREKKINEFSTIIEADREVKG